MVPSTVFSKVFIRSLRVFSSTLLGIYQSTYELFNLRTKISHGKKANFSDVRIVGAHTYLPPHKRLENFATLRNSIFFSKSVPNSASLLILRRSFQPCPWIFPSLTDCNVLLKRCGGFFSNWYMRGAVVLIAAKKILGQLSPCGQMSLYGLLPDTLIICILSPGKKQITEATAWERDRRALLSRIILAESLIQKTSAPMVNPRKQSIFFEDL